MVAPRPNGLPRAGARLAALVVLLLASPARGDTLRAGFGSATLPAPIGGPLGGYGGLRDRSATSVLDPPLAIALLLEGGSTRVALVTLDLVIARPALRETLRERVRDLDLDGLALIATHTHSGPGGYLPGWVAERVTGGSFDPARPHSLVDAAEKALRGAADDLAPAVLGSVTERFARARNRRRPGGIAERELPLVVLQAGERAPILVFSYGAHPTLLSPASRAYSGDYPGAARRALERAGYRPLFLPGPLGDQAPSSPLVAGEPDRVEELGRALARAAAAGLDTSRLSPAALAFVELNVDAPPRSLRRFCPLWWVAPLVRSTLVEFVSPRAPFQALRIGDAVLVLTPAEPSSALGDRIRAAVDEAFPAHGARLVVSHANDWLGYAVTPETFRRGGYEACMSLHGADFGPWVVEQATLALRSLESRGAAR